MESQRKRMPTGMLTNAYRLFMTGATPLIAVGLACSARGRRRYAERFGSWEEAPATRWWMHGASVGEVQGLLPLISAIKATDPQGKILLTSTSPTGLDRAGESVDYRRLLPIDTGVCIRRALSVVRPELFVLAETELWPNFLSELVARDVPIHVVNGRVSDYTFAWYKRLASVFHPILSQARSVCVADPVQRERFLELGVRHEVIHVTGHTKYDTEPKVNSEDARRAARGQFFPGESEASPVLVLGSLRPGEETPWLAAISDSLAEGKGLKVVLAPRHMEKVGYFVEKVRESGIPWRLWSDAAAASRDLVILDTMGRLEDAYAIASLAFIGGTLVDIGGHNPLEAAMYGVPVVVGPYTSVIRDVVEQMRRCDGRIEIAPSTDLKPLIKRLVDRDPTLREIGVRGREVWCTHRGAVARVLKVLANA